MAEMVVVRQTMDFETKFLAEDPDREGELIMVESIYDLDPYGMLLASLGSCTAILVNTYAHHHDIPLEETQLRLQYERVFREDCEHCEEFSFPSGQYKERINVTLSLKGDITNAQKEKLLRISLQCPVHKLFESGIRIDTRLEKEAAGKK